MAVHFTIDPDITRAWTPPARMYTDAAFYAAARERIFARSWQLVAHLDQARVPGQVYPFTLLEGCLDAPLLLVCDRADRLHCMSNVCTHRGMLVCEHAGIESFLRCRYHGRRFALDGKFESMPEFEEAADFPGDADNLPRVPLATWGPFIFAALGRGGSFGQTESLSSPDLFPQRGGQSSSLPTAEAQRSSLPECPNLPPYQGRTHGGFDDWIAPVRERVGWMPISQFKFDASRSRDYLVRANWALYCENYLEGFHIPFVHSSLAETLDYGSYRTELFDRGSVQIGVARGGENAFSIPAGSPDHGREIAGYYFWLFPNLMLNFYPWGLSINVVRPLGVDRTRVSFLSYVWDESKLDAGAGAGLDRVEREDEAIVEAVQRGLQSRLYDRGRYSPTREQGTHHFHRMLAEAMLTETYSERDQNRE